MEKDISKLIYSICILFFVIGIFYYLARIDISSMNKSFKNENKAEYSKSEERHDLEEYNSTLKINENKFLIDIAEGKEETQMGLSGRKSMCDTCGMFFIFEGESNYAFWMKDMSFDIDIIFIDGNKKIVEIYSDVKKEGYNKKSPELSEKIKNTKPAIYVLEVNAGKAKEHNFKIGDSVVLK
jgi:uncharacterized membrane protein (UPF0127 family)